MISSREAIGLPADEEHSQLSDQVRMLRLGIVGFGKQGRVHAQRIWAAENSVTHCFDQALASEAAHLDITLTQTLDELLSPTARLDLVVVATPPETHFDVARRALFAGKHVVVEKPTTLSLKDTDSLLRLAAEKDCVLATHFNRRSDPDFRALRAVQSTGRLGPIHHLESRVSDQYTGSGDYPQRSKWKLNGRGGGIMLDWAPHLLDQLLELFPDDDPLTLFCASSRPNGIVAPHLEEQFLICLCYPFRTAILSATWNAVLPLPRWYVLGQRGAMRIDSGDPLQGALRYFQRDRLDEISIPETEAPEPYPTYFRRLLDRPDLQALEARRMRQVSYAIDLAMRSASGRTALKWDPTLGL